MEMKMNNEQRQKIWEKYNKIKFRVIELSLIVQNEVDITEDMLRLHDEDTKELIAELTKVNNEIHHIVNT